MNSTYIEYIGWTLIHSTWLLLVIGQLFVLADALTRRASAKWRYRLSLFTMLLMATVPVAAMAYVVSTTKVDTAVPTSEFEPVNIVVPEASPSTKLIAQTETETTSVSEVVDELNFPKAQESRAEQVVAQQRSESASWFLQVQTALKSRLPEIVYAWLCGLALFGLRPVIGLRQMSRLRRSGRSQLPTWVEDLGVETAQRFRMRVVEMSASTLVQVPTVVGFLRPVILLPGSMITGLNAEQLHAVIAHELAHVKRMDTFVRVFQVALETVFFYHPMVWWVSRRMNEEREHCCDDLAIQVTEDRLSYSRMLLTVEELRGTTPSMAVAASGGSLLSRIQRIVGTKPEDAPTPKLLVTLLALLIVAAAVPLMETRETFAKESEQVDDEIAEQTRILDQLRSLGVQSGNNHGHLVKELHVHNCAESACWPLIAQLETLESLKIWGTEFTAQEARHIEALKRLRSLEIVNCRNVMPDVLKSIGKLKNLEELRVMFNVFSNDKEENLKRLGALTEDEASLLEDISGPERKKLHIAVSTIWMDRAVPQLKGLKKLHTLELMNSFMSDVGLGHLHPLRKLESLQFSGTTFSETALQKFVKSHPQLHKLSRWNANDADLEILAELKHLEELDVWAGDVTDKGAASLAKMTKLKRLDINGHQMSDAGLEHLTALSNLERLMMRHMSGPATDDGIAAMQKELSPDCLIHYSFSKSEEPSLESLPDWAQFEEIPNWFMPDPYPESGYRDNEGDAWNMLRLAKAARQELGITDEQFARISVLNEAPKSWVRHFSASFPEPGFTGELYFHFDRDTDPILIKDQIVRLNELLLQKKGRDYLNSKAGSADLELTAEQQSQIREAISAYGNRIREFAPQETVHIRQAAFRRLWFDFHEILTPQQRERFRHLRGPLEKQDLQKVVERHYRTLKPLPDWAQFEEIPNWFTPDPYPQAGYSETKGDAWNWFRLVKFARVELGLSQQRADQFALLYDLAPDRFNGVTHLLKGKPFAVSVLDEWRRHDVDPRMIVSVRQLERLDQLLLQKKGREFFIGDEAPHAMALTPKQHQSLKDAVSRYQERIREFAPKETVHIRQAAYRRLWFDFHEILTPQQRERYRQLRGPLERQDLSQPPRPKIEIPPAQELTVLVGHLQGRVLAVVDADSPATLDEFDFDAVEDKESTVVVIRAEKDVPAAEIQRIIERLKQAGFEKFALMAIKDGNSAVTNRRGVVYEFGASWSAPSRQMFSIVDKLKREGLPIQTIDIDQQLELVKQFEIEGVPTFVLVIDGQEVDRVIGKVKEAELRRMIELIPDPSAQAHDDGVMPSVELPAAAEESLDLPRQANIVIGRRDGEVLVVVNDQPAVRLSGFGAKHVHGISDTGVVISMETSITAADARKLTNQLESLGFSKYTLKAENKSDNFWKGHAQQGAVKPDNDESVIVLGRPRESNGNLLAEEIFAVVDDQEPVMLEQLSAENLDVAMDKLVVIQAEEKIPLKDMERLIEFLQQKEIADIQVSLWREAVIPNHQVFPGTVNGSVDIYVGYFGDHLQVNVADNSAPLSEYAKLLDKHVPSHREVLIRIQPSVPFEAIQELIKVTSEYEFKSVNLTGAYSLSSVMQPMPVKVGYLRIGSREVRTTPYVFCYQKSAKLNNSTQFFKDLFDQRVKNLGVRLAKRIPVVLKADEQIPDELLQLARDYAIKGGFETVRLDSSHPNKDAATPLSSGRTSPVSKPIPLKR